MGSTDKPVTPFRSADETEAPLTNYYDDSASSSSSGYRDLSLSVDEADHEDEPRRRFWIRRFLGISSMIYWSAVIVATVSGGTYYAGETNASQAQLTQQTRSVEYICAISTMLITFNRIVATIIVLVLLQVTNLVTVVVWWTSRGRVQLMPVLVICAVANSLVRVSDLTHVCFANYDASDRDMYLSTGSHAVPNYQPILHGIAFAQHAFGEGGILRLPHRTRVDCWCNPALCECLGDVSHWSDGRLALDR